ncbi:hypothetical protein GCM10010304_11600 [Streptomyces roseoviolaceus]
MAEPHTVAATAGGDGDGGGYDDTLTAAPPGRVGPACPGGACPSGPGAAPTPERVRSPWRVRLPEHRAVRREPTHPERRGRPPESHGSHRSHGASQRIRAGPITRPERQAVPARALALRAGSAACPERQGGPHGLLGVCSNGSQASSFFTVHRAQMMNPEIAIITTDQTG